jgi:putative transposase
VIQRGNNREAIFRAERDYRFFLDKLRAAADKHQCDLHAYVLMTNHVHLLVTPHGEDGIGKMMQMLGRYYVQYFNRSGRRTGTLWEGRYRATLIDSEQYLLTCMRYIELNPVRARHMAAHPADYPWSSYRSNALGREDPLLTPHLEYRRLGSTAEERQAAYRQLFRAHLPEATLEAIRAATNKAWVLGSERFKRRIAKTLARPVQSRGHGGDRKSERYRRAGARDDQRA